MVQHLRGPMIMAGPWIGFLDVHECLTACCFDCDLVLCRWLLVMRLSFVASHRVEAAASGRPTLHW